MQILHCAVCI